MSKELFLGSSLADVNDIRVGVMLGDIRNPTFFAYLWQTIETLECHGCQVTLVDIPSIVTRGSAQKTFLKGILKDAPPDIPAKYKSEFISRVLKRNLNTARIISAREIGDSFTTSNPVSISRVMDSNQYSDLLKSSVASIYQTKLSGSINLSVCPNKYTNDVARLVDSFLNTKQYLINLDISAFCDAVILINGRQPHQAACIEYAIESGLDWYSVEHGLKPREGFHFEPFLPQDFQSIQQKYLKKALPSDKNLCNFNSTLHSWFKNQRYCGPSFGPGNSRKDSKLARASNTVFTIFTSSLSEYDFIIQGQEKSWSQYDALEKVVKKILGDFKEAKIIVRIHPNQRNYSWHDLVNLNRVLTRLPVEVVYPWSEISSYSLLDLSDYVVVWNSTIGLEAVYWGKKTLCLANSYYNLIVDMPLLTPENISTFEFQTAIYPHPDRALEGLRVMLYNGEEFKSDSGIESDLIALRTQSPKSSRCLKTWNLTLHLSYLFDGKYFGSCARPVLIERVLLKFFTPKIAHEILNSILRRLSR